MCRQKIHSYFLHRGITALYAINIKEINCSSRWRHLLKRFLFRMSERNTWIITSQTCNVMDLLLIFFDFQMNKSHEPGNLSNIYLIVHNFIKNRNNVRFFKISNSPSETAIGNRHRTRTNLLIKKIKKKVLFILSRRRLVKKFLVL